MTKDIKSLATALALSVALYLGVSYLADRQSLAQQGGGNVGAPGTGNAGYPPGSTPITAVFSGADTTTAAATLAAAAAKFTYVCGFNIGGLGATTVTIVSPTVGTLTGGNTLTYSGAYTFATGAAVADTPFNVTYSPCVPGNAVNTGIAVTVPGAAGNTSTTINAWGYQQ